MSQLLFLIPVLPLAGFLVNGLLRLPKPVAGLVGCAGPAASFVLSVMAFGQIPVAQSAGTWFSVGSFSVPFGLRVDELSGIMLLVVTGIGSLIHVYSVAYMRDDDGFSRFFAYLNLFMFSMLMLVLGDSVVLMFLGWEGVGLCSYLLIGFWYKDLKNADAGKKAFITNRIGDLGFILGSFCLWQLFGTLDFQSMSVQKIANEPLAWWAAALLFVGACGKSAQIPLYVWLPDAMAGPTPVSALIHAATMVTAGVYMMARMNFLYAVSGFLPFVGVIAALTAALAGVIAVAQNDIKKILAYSTVSQLGFMFAGLSTGQFTTGMFHVVTHAFFKALLFLGAGAVIHALHGEQDIRKMGGLGRKLPALAIVFVCGALSLAGLPYSAGFMSKDAILAAVFMTNKAVWALLAFTAFLTAFYTTRLMAVVFLTRKEEHPHPEMHKPGLLMMVPLALLAALSLAGGVLLNKPMDRMLGKVWGTEAAAARHQKALLEGTPEERSRAEIALRELGPTVEPLLKAEGEATKAVERITHGFHAAHTFNVGLSFALFGLGTLSALFCYTKGRAALARFVEGPGKALHTLVSNKFYVDEIYEYLVLAPVKMGATVMWFLVDRILIDALLVNGTAKLVYGIGWIFRRPHTGSINLAVGSFVVGALAMLAWMLFRVFPR